jgi:hypothetical protein
MCESPAPLSAFVSEAEMKERYEERRKVSLKKIIYSIFLKYEGVFWEHKRFYLNMKEYLSNIIDIS